MDQIEHYRTVIKELLQEVAGYVPSTESVRTELLFDDERGHYQLCVVGWEGTKRVHNIMMHFDLIDGKIWVQENATDIDLEHHFFQAGVLFEHIMPGMVPPQQRQYSDFAIA